MEIKDLIQIPPTHKMHYRKNFPIKVLSKGFTMHDNRLYKTTSSGTAGERLITMEIGLLYLKRAMETLSVYPEVAEAFSKTPRRHIRYAAPNCSDVECANPNSTIADRLLSDGTLVLSVYHDLLTTTEKIIDNNLKELSLFKPSMYYIDSTHLAFLSREMKKRKYTPPKAPILSSYTLPTHISKRQVIEVFGPETPYAEFVSMSEIGWLAMECSHHSLHINNKSYYIEFINNNKQAKPDELAELYVTTIDNGCTPKIRYKTGDIYKYKKEKCSCGHSFPIVELHGRLKDFIFKNEKIIMSPRDVDNIIGDVNWLNMYQFQQHTQQDFELKLITNEFYSEGNEEGIKEELKLALGQDSKLTITLTDYIPTERSGKYLSCISNIGRDMVNNGFQI